MAAKINGNAVLLNETVLFGEGDVVTLSDKISCAVVARPTTSPGIAVSHSPTILQVALDGMGPGEYSKLFVQDVPALGRHIRLMIEAWFVGNDRGRNLYRVHITAIEI